MSYSNQINFMPDEFVRRNSRRKRILLIALGSFLLVATGSGAFYFFRMHNWHRAEPRDLPVAAPSPRYAVENRVIEQFHNPADTNPQYAQAQPVMATPQRTPSAPLDGQSTDIQHVPLNDLLNQVNSALPQGVTLTSVMLESRRITRAGDGDASDGDPIAFSITVKIYGTARTDVEVAQFINRLGKSPVLKTLNLQVSDESGGADDKPRQFHLEMGLDPALAPRVSDFRAGADPHGVVDQSPTTK